MAEEQKSEEKVKPTPKQTIVGIVAMVLLCGGPCTFILLSGPDEPDVSYAQVRCQNAVKKLLKFPDAAEFPFGVGKWDKTETEFHFNYEVHGEVIAKNAFGVPSRRGYACNLTWEKPKEGEEANPDVGWAFASGPTFFEQ